MGVKVVTVIRWYVQDEVNQDYSKQNEVDGMKKGAAHIKIHHGLSFGTKIDDIEWPWVDYSRSRKLFKGH